MRNVAQSDDAYLAAVTPLLDGLYRWSQDQLANPGKPARPE
jgi:hypothetical protein